MNDDFMAPFRKGKAKEPALKPWQSSDGETVKQTKQRCWDGLSGCEAFKGYDQFKWHRRICSECVIAMTHRFGFAQKDAEVLALLLWQEDSLFKSAKALGAGKDKITALEKTQTQRLPAVWNAVQSAGNQKDKIAAATMDYRQWFHTEAGVTVTRGAAAHGFASMARTA